MGIVPGVYFSRLDFVCVVPSPEGSLTWLKHEAKKDKFTYGEFEYDLPNKKVTRLRDGEERRITEADEFGISFEPFRL